MDQQAAAADGVAEAGDPGDHIDQQQGCTETLAFMAFVHHQPGALLFRSEAGPVS
ncbi:MAG: hypothetical protein NTV57_12015 [Cyanobacteria bacterium]|nr:hypothetical protein [Cyanobacteriota bacterium]